MEERALTCEELIEILKGFPPKCPVIYQQCSDWSNMLRDQVGLDWIDVRQNRYVGPYPPEIYGTEEKQVQVQCVTFPGN